MLTSGSDVSTLRSLSGKNLSDERVYGMRVAIGADHAGYGLKEPLVKLLEGLDHDVVDVGAYALDPTDDYPDSARAVAERVAGGQADRGVLVCGSGVGACVAANKVRGVRASVCHDTYSARQGVEHDDMNVLCLGLRVVGEELAKELVSLFVSASFSGAERHRRRLGKVLSMEEQRMEHPVVSEE